MSRTTRNSKKSQNKSNDKPSQIFIENTSLDSNSNLQQFLLNHLVKKVSILLHGHNTPFNIQIEKK